MHGCGIGSGRDEVRVSHMTEVEVLVPVKCPVCSQQSPTGFRMSVVADAIRTGEFRLYATCHVMSWEASRTELEEIYECLDAGWSADIQEACRDLV